MGRSELANAFGDQHTPPLSACAGQSIVLKVGCSTSLGPRAFPITLWQDKVFCCGYGARRVGPLWDNALVLVLTRPRVRPQRRFISTGCEEWSGVGWGGADTQQRTFGDMLLCVALHNYMGGAGGGRGGPGGGSWCAAPTRLRGAVVVSVRTHCLCPHTGSRPSRVCGVRARSRNGGLETQTRALGTRSTGTGTRRSGSLPPGRTVVRRVPHQLEGDLVGRERFPCRGERWELRSGASEASAVGAVHVDRRTRGAVREAVRSGAAKERVRAMGCRVDGVSEREKARGGWSYETDQELVKAYPRVCVYGTAHMEVWLDWLG